MKTNESGEMYLETILILQNKTNNVRAIDVATELNYSKPSVSRAMSILKSDGFIYIDEFGFIKFTAEGLEKASRIYERHNVISKFLLKSLNIDEKTASDDACLIEHIISEKSLLAMKEYIKNN